MKPATATVQPGARVTLHLRLASADGVEVENTFDGAPMNIVVGDGTLAEGLESALLGLAAGATSRIELAAGAAFGEHRADLIHALPLTQFPGDVEPGFIWSFTTPTGEELAGTVLRIEGQRVIVDFNHPLAGEPAVLDVEMLSVDAPQRRVES